MEALLPIKRIPAKTSLSKTAYQKTIQNLRSSIVDRPLGIFQLNQLLIVKLSRIDFAWTLRDDKRTNMNRTTRLLLLQTPNKHSRRNGCLDAWPIPTEHPLPKLRINRWFQGTLKRERSRPADISNQYWLIVSRRLTCIHNSGFIRKHVIETNWILAIQ